MLASHFFRHLIRVGTLTVVDAYGKTHRFAGAPGPSATVRLHDRALHHRLPLNPYLAAGEAYMDGTLTVEDGTIYDALDLACRNGAALDNYPMTRLQERLKRLLQAFHTHNPIERAQRNVAHHYDLSDQLYDLFLDRDRQYSCAYFAAESDSLETAQENKKRHIASKLLLDRQRLRVLDIGSGWGGLGLYLAQESGADVTGVTLSAEQHKVSQARAADAGLAERVRFHLRDYREESGRYDRIVSVGMFEHVGVPHYREFFQKLKDLLVDDGVALLHSIGSIDPPGGTNPWLQKYIFPGGYTPALSEVMDAVQAAGLWVTDIEILRLHYAETLRAWRQRFSANRDRVRALYDERFCRMWDFYLTGCELSFRYGGQMVFQMQLAKQPDAVPLTRDYMIDWERAHLAGGRARLRAVR